MTTIRRKRDDDSTFHSNSQCSGGGGGMDASQASMVALDASTIATDSSIPRRRRKRRRTNNNNNLLDQLQHINISNGEVGVPEQIVPHSVAADDNSQTLTSSEDEIDDDTDDEGSQTHTAATTAAAAVALLLSDAEHAQRSVMRELVFGRPPTPAPLNPVDRKLQTLVRQSLANVQQGLPLTETTTPTNVASTQDDMTIDPAYARGNDRDSFDGHLSRLLFPAAATAAATATATATAIPPPLRQRSNSLPEGLMEDAEAAAAATMDLG